MVSKGVTLADCGVEESIVFAAIGCEVEVDGCCTGGSSIDRNVFWITSELRFVSLCSFFITVNGSKYLVDVLLHPLQRKSLIQKASIEISTSFDLLASKETPGTNTVIYLNNDNIMITCFNQAGGVHIRALGIESTTFDENQNGVRTRLCRSIDIEEKTVFGSSQVNI